MGTTSSGSRELLFLTAVQCACVCGVCVLMHVSDLSAFSESLHGGIHVCASRSCLFAFCCMTLSNRFDICACVHQCNICAAFDVMFITSSNVLVCP